MQAIKDDKYKAKNRSRYKSNRHIYMLPDQTNILIFSLS